MGRLQDEERMIRWVFNSKNDEILNCWVNILIPDNFNFYNNKMIMSLLIDDYDKSGSFDEVINQKGFEYYRELAAYKINERVKRNN